MERPSSPPSSARDEDFEEEPDDFATEEPDFQASAVAPFLTAGWRPAYSNWVIDPEKLVGSFIDKEGKPQPLDHLSFAAHEQHGKTVFYFRPRLPSEDPDRHLKNCPRALVNSLSSLSATLTGSSVPFPKVELLRSNRATSEVKVKDFALSDTLTLEDLEAVWAVRTAGDKSGTHDKDKVRADARPPKIL